MNERTVKYRIAEELETKSKHRIVSNNTFLAKGMGRKPENPSKLLELGYF
jgi:hypothetical protein